MLLDRASNIELKLGKSQWQLPEGLLGLWAIQSTQFQKDNDVYTKNGLLSFLGWFIHLFEHQLVHHHYIANYFAHKSLCLHKLLSMNLVANLDIYIPIFFYLIYFNRQDLKDNFDLKTEIGRFRFFQWVTTLGYQEYSQHQLYFNHISQSATINVDRQAFTTLLASEPFDELWYLQIYPDIQAAVEANEIGSGLEHWNTYGRTEGRLPSSLSLDKRWYLKAYPDVNEQIKHGQLDNVAQHWARQGYHEGRLPYPPKIIELNLDLS